MRYGKPPLPFCVWGFIGGSDKRWAVTAHRFGRGEVSVRDLDGVVSPFQGFAFLGCVMSQGLRLGL